jgi:fructokinase
MEARWGAPPATLAPDHAAFGLEAQYLALACTNWICTLSPQRIILGGGVMQPHLFPLVHDRIRSLLAGYIDAPEVTEQLDRYIVPPGLGSQAGVLGALALGISAYQEKDKLVRMAERL